MNFKEIRRMADRHDKGFHSSDEYICLLALSNLTELKVTPKEIYELLSKIKFKMSRGNIGVTLNWKEIMRAIEREFNLKEKKQFYKGGRKNKIKSIIETLKIARKKGYSDKDLKETLENNWGELSRTSKWRIKKEVRI